MKKLLGIGLAVVLAAVIAPAAVAEPKFDSQVTIDIAAGKTAPLITNFFGKVKSGKNACEPQRKVVVYGRATEHSNPKALGSDKTNGNGEWAVNASTDDSYFYAKAKAREISAGLCKGARSEQIHPG